MFGLIIASIINYYETRILKIMKNNEVGLKSVVTCPLCRHQKEETMPTMHVNIFMNVKNVKLY